MATLFAHAFFGAGTAYAISQPHKPCRKFLCVSAVCQCLPDLDVLSYLFHIAPPHPLGHRGLTHSGVFALVAAFLVTLICYRQLKLFSLRWWSLYGWFFLMTLAHGILDAMVDDTLGAAFLWPLTPRHYHLPWRPFLDYPLDASALMSMSLWTTIFLELQFCSMLVVALFIARRMSSPVSPSSALPVLSHLEA
jgi:inner membrane protein